MGCAMGAFDFVNGDEFRSSLERDNEEMEMSLSSGAWKAVLVLAGSILEAVLADYLTGIPQPSNGQAIDKLGLADLIKAARSQNVISEQAAELSTVVRLFRNLIHQAAPFAQGSVSTKRVLKSRRRSLVCLSKK